MKKTRIVNINLIFIIIVVFIFARIIFQVVYVGLGNIKVKTDAGEVALSTYAKNRNTVNKTLYAKRGTIFSSDKEVLAKDVNSYTVIAYLKNQYDREAVEDKEGTADALAPILKMKPEAILKLLNTKDLFQIELGPGGRGITDLVKDEIDALGLKGIDFVESTKRYYPNGDFCSYVIGYAKNYEDKGFVGEMGVEQSYNKVLSGKNGNKEFQVDKDGYQILNLPSVETPATTGNDVYLTIDTNVQMFVEQAMEILEKSKSQWATLVAVDAKTGKILGVASSPGFNNNLLNIKSYYDPLVSYAYEPGSVMKVFSFMASIENGNYDGSAKYKSGHLKIDDATIKDWNNYGWGTVTYDEGFMASSNVAASKLALKLGRAKLKDFYSNMGFGSLTGVKLPNETKGTINFRYNTEVATASFGQGISVNAIQMIQGLTAVANEGTVLKPYIVEKVVDSQTGEILEEYGRTEVAKVTSKETVDKIKDLMYGVVNNGCKISTGGSYRIKNYDIMGKTGTAEIASTGGGGYISGSYVKSFAGIFPKDDPKVIVYAVASKMKNTGYLPKAVKSLIKDVSTYLNVYDTTATSSNDTFTLKSYINTSTKETEELLNKSDMTPVVIGTGDTIINHYPSKGIILTSGSKVFLVTNNNEYKMPNMIGWSRNEIDTFASFTKLKVSYEGFGYATKQSITKNSLLNSSSSLEITLEPNYKTIPEEISTKKDENTNKKTNE